MSRRVALLVVVWVLVSRCSGSSDILAPGDVAGQYQTTLFTIQISDQSFDVLALGGFINLSLNADLTTVGRLFIPGSSGLTDNGDLDVSLAGTFSISENSVTFQQAADTFIRKMVWNYSNNNLTASKTFGDETISVELTRN